MARRYGLEQHELRTFPSSQKVLLHGASQGVTAPVPGPAPGGESSRKKNRLTQDPTSVWQVVLPLQNEWRLPRKRGLVANKMLSPSCVGFFGTENRAENGHCSCLGVIWRRSSWCYKNPLRLIVLTTIYRPLTSPSCMLRTWHSLLRQVQGRTPLYRGDGGSERLSDCPNVTQKDVSWIWHWW